MSQTILQRIASGDATAVEECLSCYRPLVWSLARRSSPNLNDAEDAVQEIFVDVWRSAARFDPKLASEGTFISIIARRRLIDRHRRQRRRLDVSTTVEPQDVTAPATPDRMALQEEAAKVLQRWSNLRPLQRRVLELSIHDGLSQTEIARLINLPLGSVKTHARRGLIRLRQLLEESTCDAETEEPS